jgi:hypothetical protein
MFHKANSMTTENQSCRSEASSSQWQAPSQGKIKVNWDATIDKKKGLIGFGVIARDSKGRVLVARSSSKPVCIEPVMAESWAGLHVVLFCKEIGLFDIVAEGDALQVVKEINLATSNLSRYGHFIDGIKTHILAKAAITQVIESIWLEEIPPLISDVVCRKLVVHLS